MDVLHVGLVLRTASPVHHGYTAAVGDEKKIKLVRQVAVLVPNSSGQWTRRLVPVLGGNALRGRMRRVAAYETLKVLELAPEDFTNARRAFHTITSGGTMVRGGSHLWSDNPSYRQDRIAEWPLLSLMGFSFDDFMQRSKLRVHFGWPLLSAIRSAVELPMVDSHLFGDGDWIDLEEGGLSLAIEGSLTSRGLEQAHYEYRHADDDLVPMPEKNGTDKDEDKKNDRAAMVVAYQYVPVGVPFGIRMLATDLNEVEQSLLRLMIEQSFPAEDMIVFGSRATSGLGVFRVQRRSGVDHLPDPEVYRDYLRTHREALRRQLLRDHDFLHDPDARAGLKKRADSNKKDAVQKEES